MLRVTGIGEAAISRRDKIFLRQQGVPLRHGLTTGQDAYMIDPEHGCFAVADGVGSSQNADKASRAVCDAYQAAIIERYSHVQTVDRMSRDYNKALLSEVHAAALGALATTTFTGLTVHPDGVASYLHVGDSQLCLLRDGTLINYTSEHVQPNGYNLLNYLGTQPEWKTMGYERHELQLTLQANMFSRTKLEAEWGEIQLRENDRFALMTDGILGSQASDRLSGRQLREIMMRPLGAAACAQALLEASRKIDDSTAIILDIGWVEP